MTMLTRNEMAARYRCYKRGTTEPSPTAFATWATRHPEKLPPQFSRGRWLLADVERWETEKPWLNAKPKKAGGRKRNCDFELRVG